MSRPLIITDASILPPPGKNGRDGKDGNDGETIVGPPGLNFRGRWKARYVYKLNDAVYHDGSSYVCVVAETGREPDEDSRYWSLLAVKGEKGAKGDWVAGPRGPGSGRLNDLIERVTELEESGTGGSLPIAAIFDSSALAGMAIYVPSDGHADLANNDNENQTAVGICFADVLAGAAGQFVTEGEIERDDWTAVAGTTDLTPGATYYLGLSGGIISTPVNSDGLIVQPIGFALSKRMLSAEISTEPILL